LPKTRGSANAAAAPRLNTTDRPSAADASAHISDAGKPPGRDLTGVAALPQNNEQTEQNSPQNIFSTQIEIIDTETENTDESSIPSLLHHYDILPINTQDLLPRPQVLKLKITIDNSTIDALIDTGASISILCSQLLLPSDKLKQCKNLLLRGVSGKLITILGTVTKTFYIGEKAITQTFAVVPDFRLKAILGLDFLIAHEATIDCANRTLQLAHPSVKPPTQQAREQVIATAQEETPDPKEFASCAKAQLRQSRDIRALKTTKFKVHLNKTLEPGHYLAYPRNRLLLEKHLYIPSFTFYANEFPEEIFVRNISAMPQRLFTDQTVFDIYKTDDIPGIDILSLTPQCSAENPPSDVDPLKDISINPDLSENQQEQIKALLNKYKHLFHINVDELPVTNKIQHVITMKPGVNPIKQRPYREAAAQKHEMRKEIDRLLAKKIIQPSSSPWSSPAFIIKKKNGEARLVLDLRKINENSVEQTYFLPLISDILNSFNGVKYMATFDLFNAFFQVNLEENSRKFTAFNCSAGCYEFWRLPFGLQGAPSTFQNLTDSILADIKWTKVFNYLDDIIIIGKTFQEFLENMEEVLKRFCAANLKFKAKKSFVGYQELNILGWHVSQNGIGPDPERASILSQLKAPQNINQLYRTMGMFSYYRNLIPSYAQITAPLYALCKKDAPFIWGQEQETAFRTLLQSMANPPILAHYDPKAPTFLEVDTAKMAIGSILSQEDKNGVRRPICFASRALTAQEQKLASAAMECLGLTWSILKLKYYLYGINFTVLSDSHAICSIKTLKDPYGRIARLLLRLQEFRFILRHISGKKHVCADFFSRQPADWPEFDEKKFEEELEIPTYLATAADIKSAQQADALLQPIISELNKNETTNKSRNYSLIDGILYKRGSNIRGNANLLVVPEQLKKEIMTTFHDDILHGSHLSYAKCIDKIRLRFYWINMLKEVKQFIKACPVCQAFNKPTQKKFGSLQPVPRPEIPFFKIALDFAGPFVRSSNKNKYLLIGVDYCTNWVELKAMRKATAQETAKFLLERYITRTGIFHELVTDRSTIFCGTLITELLKVFNARAIMISAYHAPSNGRCERMVKTVKSVIAKYCSPTTQKNWDSQLLELQYSINTSPHSSMRESPYAMVYNRQPLFPAEIMAETPLTHPIVQDIRNRMVTAEKIIAENYAAQQKKDKARFDAKRQFREFNIGDWVMVYKPTTKLGLSKKLLAQYYGPFQIAEKISDITFRVKKSTSKNAPLELVNIDRLKPYFCSPHREESAPPAAESDSSESDSEANTSHTANKEKSLNAYCAATSTQPTSGSSESESERKKDASRTPKET
jgi:RNase H-like domain found in reverse transcriptase/Reverse transcriptase (RNA-dependent DNA polymerase)/Integrase zinc binding domain/Retroviral aspartyl protease